MTNNPLEYPGEFPPEDTYTEESMRDKPELQPCPVCSKKPQKVQGEGWGLFYQCVPCGIVSPKRGTESDAIHVWNGTVTSANRTRGEVMKKVYLVVDMFQTPVAVFSSSDLANAAIDRLLEDIPDNEQYEVWDFVLDEDQAVELKQAQSGTE